jgi:hypothetical protein
MVWKEGVEDLNLGHSRWGWLSSQRRWARYSKDM